MNFYTVTLVIVKHNTMGILRVAVLRMSAIIERVTAHERKLPSKVTRVSVSSAVSFCVRANFG